MDHQEFAQLLGNYGEFVGSIGVVATLVYLALQMRQNTRATLSQIREYRSAASQANFHQASNMADLVVKSMAGESLSDAEHMRLRFMANAAMRGYEAYTNQRRDGFLGDDEWEAIQNTMRGHFRAPYMDESWRASQLNYSLAFRTMVNGEILNVAPQPSRDDG